MNKIELPKVREFWPKLVAKEFVSVQPMAKPSDLAKRWDTKTVIHVCTENCKRTYIIHDFIKGYILGHTCPGEGTKSMMYTLKGG